MSSSANVLEALSKKNKNLRVAATENADLTKTFMALLSNLIILCNRKGRSIKNVKIRNVEITRDALGAAVRASIQFGGGSVIVERSLLEERGKFFDYTQQKAGRLATAIDDNPNLIAFLGRLVTAVKNYAAHHQIPYHRLRVDGAIIDKNNVFFMRLFR